ncbi:hypothetical protein FFLO_05872 [Filobasidium floriforme]|uniref:Uncharacterized protein n=1 Tax=Filobasidium floriforme TaxID=5210 RepID=A0A8K0JG34_9TREE|nr:uncharacterized protein HD553DRAFT_325227 [Filobasidium floriforme]KAG7528973.1 hypothetical protein FFLO_05872 [Filobasidium floriforme]KAH8081743.1 hypothetical protein HD553DRAFT_325227 [Filobasidium floriforme]
MSKRISELGRIASKILKDNVRLSIACPESELGSLRELHCLYHAFLFRRTHHVSDLRKIKTIATVATFRGGQCLIVHCRQKQQSHFGDPTRQYFNTEGGLPISLAPRARYWQYRYPPSVGEIVARFDSSRGIGRKQAAKTVQARSYNCFDQFVLSRGNSLPGGRQSVLVPFHGHRAKSYDDAKKQLLQVIWEHAKDSSESDDAQLLDRLAMDMESITWESERPEPSIWFLWRKAKDRLPLIHGGEMAPNLSLSTLDNQFIMTNTSINTYKVSSMRGEDSWSWTKDPVTVISQYEGRSLQIQSYHYDIATWTFDNNEPTLEQPQYEDLSVLTTYVNEALSFVPRGSDMHDKLLRIQNKLETEGLDSNTDKDRQLVLEDAPGQQLADLADRSPLSVQKQQAVNPNDKDGDLPESVTAGGI